MWWVPNCICGWHLWSPSLSFSSSCFPYSFGYTHLQMYQCVDLLSICVHWARAPLLSYSCLTCKFKGTKKGIFLFCFDAEDTLLFLFHHGCSISRLFILVCLLVLWLCPFKKWVLECCIPSNSYIFENIHLCFQAWMSLWVSIKFLSIEFLWESCK